MNLTMNLLISRILVAVMCVIGFAATARAQTVTVPAGSRGWDFAVYPILVWVPIDIRIDVNIPPSGGDGGGTADILDSRFDGAFFGGVNATNGTWRIEGYGIWAAFGGDRPPDPLLKVDFDVIYGYGKLGRRIAPDLYITGGVRRVAFKYDITFGNLGSFSRKPGVWDPMVGIGWHRVGPKLEWHASFDGGGFGAGADVDLGASLRTDLKPVRHFGIALGYDLLYLKLSDSVAGRTLTVKTTFHGPTVGIGFYF
jgi:hypothetical protein